MPYDKKILIQKGQDDEWEDWKKPHAEINRGAYKEFEGGGAERSEQIMRFKVRWSRALSAIQLNTQLYRIIYREGIYDIVGYDDYKEQHQAITLEAMSYARNRNL